jgi:hypothetical protein
MQNIAKSDWRAIAQIYNQSLLKRLAFDSEMDAIKVVAEYTLEKSNLVSQSLGDLLDQLYGVLTVNYRNEYVYKNVVAQKIAIERHIHAQARLITEFRVNQSKADAVILNGTSTVYEIKTEYDDLARLAGQLADYQKAFDRIYVVTHENGVDKLTRQVSSTIGIVVLNGEMQLETLRDAESNLDKVDPLTIFDCLREHEYLDILKESLDFTPSGSRYDWYYECRQVFGTLSKEVSHAGMLRNLKARTKNGEFLEFVRQLPSSLTAIGLASEISIAQQKRILQRLANPLI